MKQHRRLGALLLLGLVCSLALSAAFDLRPAGADDSSSSLSSNHDEQGGRSHAKQIVGYFIEWGIYGRQYYVKNIVTSGSASKLTTINYAFGNVNAQNKCALTDEWADFQVPISAENSVDGVGDTWDDPLRGNFGQLKKLKARYPNIKVVISLGGWTLSGNFSAAAQPANVGSFVQSCISTFITDPRWAGLFDGIDVDWEYVAACGLQCGPPEDTPNFTNMLAEFRKQLDAVRPGLLLTIASPAGKEKYSKIELSKVQKYLSWINLMTYDFHGPWENKTNFQSALFSSPQDPDRAFKYNIEDTVNGYLQAGVPPKKLVVGVPFYGHGWAGVPNQNGGLYQPATGPAPGKWEAGSNDYKELKTLEDTYRKYWDFQTDSFWIYNPDTGIFWTYDNPVTVAAKGVYISNKNGGLGGGMFWELSGDDAQGSLISALYYSTRFR